MSYPIIIQPEAELDFEDAYCWYEQHRQGLGSEFIRAVDNCFSSIAENPFAYPQVYKETRRILVRRFPYGIFYFINNNTIFIIACFHTKRNPKTWQKRF